MSGGMIVALVLAAYLVVAAGVLGALLERERLLNPDGERGWRWLGSVALCCVFWPIVGLLWPESRPLPVPPPRSARFVLGMDLGGAAGGVTIQDEQGTVRQCDDRMSVATPRDLATVYPSFVAVWLTSHGVSVSRTQSGAWRSTLCGCVWNRLGAPQVVCRQHRSDHDPQGEPDDPDEQDVVVNRLPVDLLYKGSLATPGTRMVDTLATLVQQSPSAPNGSVAFVANTRDIYEFVGGRWRCRYSQGCQVCDHDDHRCKGCGTPVSHWRHACCAECAS